MKNVFGKIPWSLLLTLALFAYVLYRRAPDVVKNYQLEQQEFPTRQLQTTENSQISFPPKDGQRAVALFWTTWCGPCKLEMDRLQKSINANKLDASRVHAVHIGGSGEEVKAHMLKHGFSFPALVDTNGVLASALDVTMTPSLFLIDENGQIGWASSGLGLSDVWRIESFLN